MVNKIILTLVAVLLVVSSFSQTIEFIDTSFQRAIFSHDPVIDINGDNIIQQSEADSVKALNLYKQNINSIQDAHSFPNLVKISAASNNLISVKIDSLMNLETLLCAANNIEVLSVSNAPKLIDLYASGNQIKFFSTTECLNLDHLVLSGNKIESIDLSKYPNLTYLSIGSNDMLKLDVSQNPKLKQIYCRRSKVKVLDISKNEFIEFHISGFDESTKLILNAKQKKQIKNGAIPTGPPPPSSN